MLLMLPIMYKTKYCYWYSLHSAEEKCASLAPYARHVQVCTQLQKLQKIGDIAQFAKINKVDSLTFINFQENYQTAEIYFCSYHVTPLNKAVPNYCVN